MTVPVIEFEVPGNPKALRTLEVGECGMVQGMELQEGLST